MAFTSISDIVSTDAWSEYYNRASTVKTALIESGVVSDDPAIAAAAARCPTGFRLVNLPYWNDLDGDPQPIIDGTPVTTRKIGVGKDVSIVAANQNAWEIGGEAIRRAGNDPIRVFADKLVRYWNREVQKDIFALLKGVFADNVANDNSDHVLDISGESGSAAVLNKNSLLAAAQLLGDAKDNLVAVAMHSAAETVLSQGDNSATGYRPSTTPGMLSRYNDRAIIMDDMCGFDPDTGVAEIYLFGQGAIAINRVAIANETEADRDKKSNLEYLISRRANFLHVRGVKWTDASCAGDSPTRLELANAANHDRVWASKDVRVCKLVCKLA